MKRVVDSSIWIEWLTDSTLGQRLEAELPTGNDCIVPTIVQLEVYKWLLREVGEDAADQFVAYTLGCSVIPLDTALAIEAARLCRDKRLATADAIVYATALAQDADLLTCDAHFADLDQVVVFSKTG